jgi:hypothetical protein
MLIQCAIVERNGPGGEPGPNRVLRHWGASPVWFVGSLAGGLRNRQALDYRSAPEDSMRADGSHLAANLQQSLASVDERVIPLAEVQADVTRLRGVKKDRSGHCCDPNFLCHPAAKREVVRKSAR